MKNITLSNSIIWTIKMNGGFLRPSGKFSIKLDFKFFKNQDTVKLCTCFKTCMNLCNHQDNQDVEQFYHLKKFCYAEVILVTISPLILDNC